MSQELLYPPGMEPPEGVRVYNEDGVDLTQIRELLSLSYAERLERLETQANALLMMRRELKFLNDPTSPSKP